MRKILAKDVAVLLGIFALIVCVQFLGSFFAIEGVYCWYRSLQTAPWNPPNYVFGPIWSILYILMAISVWLIYLSKGSKGLCYTLFGVGLFFNLVWTLCFFSWQNVLLALIDIAILDVIVFLTIIAFYRVSSIAAYLLIPYLLWIFYATSLNIYIYVFN